MSIPARPYDPLYDGVYTVSGPRDHYRQQTMAGGFMVERCPDYANFTSDLPQYPSTTYRFKNSDKVPPFVDRAYHPDSRNPGDLRLKSDATQVQGHNRYKYFKRPMLAAADVTQTYKFSYGAAMPTQVVNEARSDAPKSKTVATQSDYRESEAQTTPWDPDYVLPTDPSVKQKYLSAKYNCAGPEVLTLKDMKFADGLPAGLNEIKHIEKLREKRAFEATLPPINDMSQLPLRQKMLEEWEEKEWREREEEILGVQEERIALLEQALQVREEEIEEENIRRVEARKTKLLSEKAAKFAYIQANRIKTMRHLIEQRKYVEKPRKLQKPTIVEQYANYGSTKYAPVQREGRFPETKPMGREIETEGYQPATLPAVLELESYLPARLLNPRISAPKRPDKLNFKERQDAAIQKDLKKVNDLLDSAKSTKGRGFGDCWPAPLSDTKTGKPGVQQSAAILAAERPSTPVLPPPSRSAREQAAVLLQRLLRGRAVQNTMYEGMTRHQDLIRELRYTEEVTEAGPLPEEIDVDIKADKLVGTALSQMLRILLDATSDDKQDFLTELDSWRQQRNQQRQAEAEQEERESASRGGGGGGVDVGIDAIALDEGALMAEADAMEAAAIKIQAAARGMHARRQVKAMKGADDTTPPSSAKKPAAPALDLTTWSEEDVERLVKAQATVRGHLTRNHFKAGQLGKNAQTPPPLLPEDSSADARAAASERSAAAHHDDKHFDPLHEEAATKIQAVQRGRRARKRVKELKRQKELLGYNVAPEHEAAVTKIAAVQRGRMARKRVAALRRKQMEEFAAASVLSATADVASFENAPEAEPSYSDVHEAAVVRIQAVQRGRQARAKVKNMQQQRQAAGVAAVDNSFTAEQNAAAVRIQAVQRGRAQRKRFEEMKKQESFKMPEVPRPASTTASLEGSIRSRGGAGGVGSEGSRPASRQDRPASRQDQGAMDESFNASMKGSLNGSLRPASRQSALNGSRPGSQAGSRPGSQAGSRPDQGGESSLLESMQRGSVAADQLETLRESNGGGEDGGEARMAEGEVGEDGEGLLPPPPKDVSEHLAAMSELRKQLVGEDDEEVSDSPGPGPHAGDMPAGLGESVLLGESAVLGESVAIDESAAMGESGMGGESAGVDESAVGESAGGEAGGEGDDGEAATPPGDEDQQQGEEESPGAAADTLDGEEAAAGVTGGGDDDVAERAASPPAEQQDESAGALDESPEPEPEPEPEVEPETGGDGPDDGDAPSASGGGDEGGEAVASPEDEGAESAEVAPEDAVDESAAVDESRDPDEGPADGEEAALDESALGESAVDESAAEAEGGDDGAGDGGEEAGGDEGMIDEGGEGEGGEQSGVLEENEGDE